MGGVSASASTTTVEEVVAEDEVIDLKPEAVEAVVVGEEKAEEPKAEAPKAAEPAVENTRATLVGNASRDPGSLVFHRNKDQKYATVYTEMEKFFPGVCPELPRPALLDGTHPGDYGFDPAGFCTTNAELYNQMEDFDPLGLYGLLGNDAVGRFTMRELELNHGRVAMLAVLSYVMLESVT